MLQLWILNGCILIIVVLILLVWSSRKYNTLQTRTELLQQLNQNLQHEQQNARILQQQFEMQITQQQQQLLQLNRELATSTEKLAQQQIWWQQLLDTEQHLEQLRQQHTQQQLTITELTTQLDNLQHNAQEKQQFLINSEQRLSEQFENLAHKIFEKNGLIMEQQQRHQIGTLLNPLREQLDSFKKQVQDSFGEEAKERHTLTFEIRNLQQLNEKMTLEAVNLTKALKGENKTQGNWGEVILQRLLELSGLHEGREFITQCALTTTDGHKQQPDVVVYLPRQRQVIIDAKMTLTAYERYCNSSDEPIRHKALQEHLQAIKQHLRTLTAKAYQTLPDLQTLDFVLMFIPIEGAFSLAIQQEPQLLEEALKQNIFIVSPTNLLAVLRTIHHIWRDEYKNQHAAKIADRATQLYDKFRLLTEDILLLGTTLTKAQDTYHKATERLFLGRGNLVKQIEQFRILGVTVKKPLSDKILKQAEDDSDLIRQEEES